MRETSATGPPDLESTPEEIEIAIIGAGPAGLMAAEVLVAAGHRPVLFDAMPTPARKFLMAGKSGLNITHSEPLEKFMGRYGEREEKLAPSIHDFTPEAVRKWCDSLGVATYVGSSGRVFPKAMKASPLLRAWLKRLYDGGATLRTRHRWTGWTKSGGSQCLTFDTEDSAVKIRARATVLALGGASWPKLGSDGTWQKILAARGIEIAPLKPANCGFEVAWSPYFRDRFAGVPIKGSLISTGKQSVKGDFVISNYGVEGSAIYTLSRTLRQQIDEDGKAILTLDLTPDRTQEQLAERLGKPRGKRSFPTHLKRATGLKGAKAGLLRECLPAKVLADPLALASAVKALPVRLNAARPLAEAISSAGGIAFEALDKHLMLKALPGTFVAGEMLDWEAPTGGYLLTGAMAQGKQAATGAAKYLAAGL